MKLRHAPIAAVLLLSVFVCVFAAAEEQPAGHGVCGDYEYDYFADCSARITFYAGREQDLYLPSSLDGYIVTSLGPEMFYRRVARVTSGKNGTHTSYYPEGACGSIVSVTVPDTVTEICDRAFAYCSGLLKVDLPFSVSSVGNNAFAGCGRVEVRGPYDSFAAEYCVERGIPFSYNGLPGQEPYAVCRSLQEFADEISYYTRLGRKKITVSLDETAFNAMQEDGFWVWLRRGGAGDYDQVDLDTDGGVYTYTFNSLILAPYLPCDTMEEVHKALAYCSSRQLRYFTLGCEESLYRELTENDCLPIARIGRFHGFFDEHSVAFDNVCDIAFLGSSYYPGFRVALLAGQGKESSLTEEETLLLNSAREIVSGIPENASLPDKEKYLHDYLCDHVGKDYHGNNSHADTDTATGAILYGAADCDGYSDAFDLLCALAGIPARMMEGAVGDEEHAWNLVSLDGGSTWYMTDVTWDDNDGEAGFISYAFLNVLADDLSYFREWKADAVPVRLAKE